MRPKSRRQGVKLTAAEHEEIHRRISLGDSFESTALAIGCSVKSIQRVLANAHKKVIPPKERSPRRLSGAEREEISRCLLLKKSYRYIASRLGRAPSTISREVKNYGSRDDYRAYWAEKRAIQRNRRPKAMKLETNAELRDAVESGLLKRWSPQQIAARLVVDYPGDETMRVSHETIYKSLFVQARGALRKELTTYLRTGRNQRRSPHRNNLKGKISNMVLISERPAEVEDRSISGHWEGDLVIGKLGKSAIATLVERRSRYLILAQLPNGRRTAPDVSEAIRREIMHLPSELRRTLTWDQGKEMAAHVQLSIDTQMKIYFCEPHSPWQRGSNENTNGLLRQYFPKGIDLNSYDQNALDEVARELNTRPRQTLDWMKPSEIFNQTVASID